MICGLAFRLMHGEGGVMGDDAINVEVCSIRELLRHPLRVPSYQRPYVWQSSNVLQLIEDIEHSAQADPASDESRYRIGTVIVYRKRNEDGMPFDIVDGQQRVVTLHLILAALGERKDDMRLDIRDDEQTRRCLCENDRAIRQLVDSWEGDRRSQFVDRMLDGCEVLKVTSYHLSEAFQMFDSQNTRGKELDPTDLLKAFHLRCMDAEGADENLKQQLVQRWELHQDEIQPLFGTYLYRIACWSRGEKAKPRGLDSDSISMFKGIDLPGRGNERQCAPWQRNCVTAWYANATQTDDESETSYTFQIDQPMINGEAFFCYAEHYRSLLQQQLMHDETPWKEACADIASFAHAWRCHYMTELFHAILLYYRDRFGDDDAAEAAKMAFLHAAYMRLSVRSLSFATVNNYVLSAERWGWNARVFEAIRYACRGRDALSHMTRIARRPIEDSNDWGLWYRYVMRNSGSAINDGGASSSQDVLSLLIDDLRHRGLLKKSRRSKRQSGIEGNDVFNVLRKEGFIIHEKRGGWRYGLQAAIRGDHVPEEWARKEAWVARIDDILQSGKETQ